MAAIGFCGDGEESLVVLECRRKLLRIEAKGTGCGFKSNDSRFVD
jgi:hypothetical protein